MNYLFAKVKRKTNYFRMLSSDDVFFDLDYQNINSIEYSPNTLIEDEEWYHISDFSNTAYNVTNIEDEIDPVNFHQIAAGDLLKLSYIIAVQADFVLYQAINSNLLVSKRWFSLNEMSLKVGEPIVVINKYPDLIYDRANDKLMFKKLVAANKIFKGMDQLYRAATDVETTEFLKEDFLEVDAAFDYSRVTTPNRRRIALVKQTLNQFNDQEKTNIYNYIQQYGNVVYNEGKFKIDTDDDLKYILWGIEQRFYTTPIGGEKRVANSIISI